MNYAHDIDAGGSRSDWPMDYRPEPESRRPRKHPTITPEMHECIKKLYLDATGNGEVRAFARRHGIPRWKISKYAQRHGWVSTTSKSPDWSDEEIRILERHAHLVEESIQRYLKRAGYSRTVTAITLKRRRMRLLQNLEGMSARMLAQCLGVDESFVRRHSSPAVSWRSGAVPADWNRKAGICGGYFPGTSSHGSWTIFLKSISAKWTSSGL